MTVYEPKVKSCGNKVRLISRDQQDKNIESLIDSIEEAGKFLESNNAREYLEGMFNKEFYKYSAEMTECAESFTRCGYAIHVNDKNYCFNRQALEPIYEKCLWKATSEDPNSTTFNPTDPTNGTTVRLSDEAYKCKELCSGVDLDCGGYKKLGDLIK